MAFRKTTGKANNNTGYVMIEDCGEITKNIRLTYGKWGDHEEKYDIRSWYKDKATGEMKAGKGISLTGEQLEVLYEILKGIAE